MSASKDVFFEIEAQQCSLWIHNKYGLDLTAEDTTGLWDEFYEEYIEMLDAEQAEYLWLERHSHKQFFHEFSTDLTTAYSLLTLAGNQTQANITYKLVYAHAVTLLEALISTVVRKLAISEPRLMLNLVTEYEALSKRTISLKQVAQDPAIVQGIVLKVLSELSFHNVATIREILGAMFGEHMKGLEMADIARICIKRHDIVHRNGKTVDDEPIDLSIEDVQQAIHAIEAFAADLKRRVDEALEKKDT